MLLTSRDSSFMGHNSSKARRVVDEQLPTDEPPNIAQGAQLRERSPSFRKPYLQESKLYYRSSTNYHSTYIICVDEILEVRRFEPGRLAQFPG